MSARPFSFVESRHDTRPTVRALTWREVRALAFDAQAHDGGKESLPLWSPAELVGGTALEHVRSISALVFDVDGSPLPRAEVVAGLQVACVAHASFSNGPAAEKMRCVLGTSRAHTVAEHPALWRYGSALLAALGVEADAKARDACRRYYVPTRREHYGISWNAYEPLDVDAALECMRQVDAAAEAEAGQHGASLARTAPLRPGSASALERASRYLANVDAAVSGQGGHLALYRAALAMVRGFALEPAEALELLLAEFNPRCLPPWPRRDVERKVREAGKASNPVGYLLDRAVAA